MSFRGSGLSRRRRLGRSRPPRRCAPMATASTCSPRRAAARHCLSRRSAGWGIVVGLVSATTPLLPDCAARFKMLYGFFREGRQGGVSDEGLHLAARRRPARPRPSQSTRSPSPWPTWGNPPMQPASPSPTGVPREGPPVSLILLRKVYMHPALERRPVLGLKKPI